jgi:hypothetical protein
VASVVFLSLQAFHRLKHSLALLFKYLVLNTSCFTSDFCRVLLVTNLSQTQADFGSLVEVFDFKQSCFTSGFCRVPLVTNPSQTQSYFGSFVYVFGFKQFLLH